MGLIDKNSLTMGAKTCLKYGVRNEIGLSTADSIGSEHRFQKP